MQRDIGYVRGCKAREYFAFFAPICIYSHVLSVFLGKMTRETQWQAVGQQSPSGIQVSCKPGQPNLQRELTESAGAACALRSNDGMVNCKSLAISHYCLTCMRTR